MKAIAYNNTATNLPDFDSNIHNKHNRGYAYETESHFIHFYGQGCGFYIISVGLMVCHKKEGTLADWVTKFFGATNVVNIEYEVGFAVKGVWRPSLYFYEDTFQALGVTENEMRLSENALRLLISKLDELFLFIEPCKGSLNVYSHKTRELLILACTELENFWQNYMPKSKNGKSDRFTTKDYVKLLDRLFLADFEFTINTHDALPSFRPFEKWTAANPTSSLIWYDSYNKTKHNRQTHFSSATLENCINAVIACLIMHCVRYSPFPMFEQNNTFSSLINQNFSARLVNFDPAKVYLYKVHIPERNWYYDRFWDPKAENLILPFEQMEIRY